MLFNIHSSTILTCDCVFFIHFNILLSVDTNFNIVGNNRVVNEYTMLNTKFIVLKSSDYYCRPAANNKLEYVGK